MTKLHVGLQQPPWRVIRAFPQASGAAMVHLHNVSGGVLAGDSLHLEIEVGAGAEAQVTSTGATRLYCHRSGAADSEQTTSISVEAGGVLEYLPDPIIPYAHSRHRQQTHIRLADQAALFGWETITPGRQAMGERFAFERLRISTRIESPSRPLLLEDFDLEPSRRAPGSAARLGDFTHAVSFYAFAVRRPAADWRLLESRLGEIAAESSTPRCTIWGASALAADGVIVKGLSVTSRALPATLAKYWTTARRFLTGREAVPPRKLR